VIQFTDLMWAIGLVVLLIDWSAFKKEAVEILYDI
jgi:hypothetical protein